MSDFVDGQVVVSRVERPQKAKGQRSQRARTVWTLHLADCMHAGRADAPMPAPNPPYPNTEDCSLCRPSDPHRLTFTKIEGGGVRVTCAICPLTTVNNSLSVAQSNINRMHRAQAAREALSASLGGRDLTDPEVAETVRVMVPRQGIVGGRAGWTLHRYLCGFLRRSANVAMHPVPDPVPEDVVPCVFCLGGGHNAAKAAKAANRTLTIDAAHFLSYEEKDDGRARGTCACGHDSGWRSTKPAARNWLRRAHAREPEGPIVP